jgi:hypothetical protein
MNRSTFFRALARCGAAVFLGLTALQASADPGFLRSKYTQLREELRNNPFQRAMVVESTEADGVLRGDVYAVLDHPYARVSQAMREPSQWCDIMLLPFNTKHCQAGDDRLTLRIGRKYDQPIEQAYRIDFGYRNVASGSDYFESRLNAAQGPIGTRDYRIVMAAVPLDSGRTFMHLSYSYGYGTAGRLAMQAYLGTVGADKVGFSMVRDGNGQPQYIGGMRGAIERNAMRYYLAIDAYLDAMDEPKHQQVEKRIQQWFASTERYPRQLREMDRATYVAMKRQEYERQQTAAVSN